MIEEPEARLRESWDRNAAAWTQVVRDRGIPSRKVGTDDAILAACGSALASTTARRGGDGAPPRVLDVGCGEGWLARALAAGGTEVLGVDGSKALVAAARENAPARCRFEVASYESIVADAACAAGPWELIVCNFALLGDPIAPLLTALGSRLSTDGRLIVQTVHPWVAAGDGAYRDEWREERFASFEAHFPAAMPWFARTLGSWITSLRAARLELLSLEEPVHPVSGRPLSLLLVCTRTD